MSEIKGEPRSQSVGLRMYQMSDNVTKVKYQRSSGGLRTIQYDSEGLQREGLLASKNNQDKNV